MRYEKIRCVAVAVILSAVAVIGCKKDNGDGGGEGSVTFPVESYIVDYTSTRVVVGYESDFDVEVAGLPSWCEIESMEPGAAVIAVERNDGDRRSGAIVFGAGGGRSEFMIVQRGKPVAANGMIRVDSLVSVGRKGAVVMLSPIYDGTSVTPSVGDGAEWIHVGAGSYSTLSQLSFTVDENTGDTPRQGAVYFTSDAGDVDSTVIWQAGNEAMYITGDITLNSYLNANLIIQIRTGTLSVGEKIAGIGCYLSHSNTYPGPGDMSLIFDYSADVNNINLKLGTDFFRGVIPGKSYNVRYAVVTDRQTYYSDVYSLSVPDVAAAGEPTIKIPVIFHVYYSRSGSVTENVPAEVLYDQIDMANLIWRGRFGYGVDTGVEFVPATHTPWGEKLPEPGIHRIAVSKPVAFDDEEFVNNADFNDSFNLWDPKRYVNVWTMNISIPDVAGYATLPLVPDARPLAGLRSGDYYFTHPIDYMHGIVIDNEYVTSLNGVTTLAHEAGHLFGLLHAFGENGCGDDDYCADTPNYDRAQYLKTVAQTGVRDMRRISCEGEDFVSVNVMDYFYGQSFAITQEQRERINHLLDYGIVGVTRSSDAVKALSYVDADAPKPEITIIH